MSVWNLGLSAFYHDSAAALVRDGEIVAAAQEERFSRKKHDAAFPAQAIEYCLREGGIGASDLANVVFYDKPLLKFERLLETYMEFAPFGLTSFARAMPIWLKDKLFLKQLLVQQLKRLDPERDWSKSVLFSEHHLSHAASAFFPSPFKDALILTIDGVGEWATTSAAIGSGSEIKIFKEIHFPHSLGLLYSTFTTYLGFKLGDGEYKVMGLAPYGTPRFLDLILENLIDLKDDGTFRLNLRYFGFCTGLSMFNSRFERLFGLPARAPEAALDPIHMDIAASIQRVVEIVVSRLARHLLQETQQSNLCLAGGVALNCVANGKLIRDNVCERLWIQPAAGDAGAALGAALVGAHLRSGIERKETAVGDGMRGAFLGPSYSQTEIEDRLNQVGAQFEVLPKEALLDASVEGLASGLALGWFQGRMEFGPRSLGARSILADARSEKMQSVLNSKVKFRESFRPFAPCVLREYVHEWFQMDMDSPYMLLVADVVNPVREKLSLEQENLVGLDKLHVARSKIPAVTHVDYSARIQTVDRQTNSLFHQLLSRFFERTGCPVLINTSFNVRDEPIVCTPEDAFRCFMGTELDILVIGQCLLRKELQIEFSVERLENGNRN